MNKIIIETKYESLDNIIKFFNKSITDYNNFNRFLSSLVYNVSKLEKEVEELDFVINLCEENLEVVVEESKSKENDTEGNNNNPHSHHASNLTIKNSTSVSKFNSNRKVSQPENTYKMNDNNELDTERIQEIFEGTYKGSFEDDYYEMLFIRDMPLNDKSHRAFNHDGNNSTV